MLCTQQSSVTSPMSHLTLYQCVIGSNSYMRRSKTVKVKINVQCAVHSSVRTAIRRLRQQPPALMQLASGKPGRTSHLQMPGLLITHHLSGQLSSFKQPQTPCDPAPNLLLTPAPYTLLKAVSESGQEVLNSRRGIGLSWLSDESWLLQCVNQAPQTAIIWYHLRQCLESSKTLTRDDQRKSG